MSKKKILYLLGILFTILIGTWMQLKLCCCQCETECATSHENAVIEKPIEAITSSKSNRFEFSGTDFNYSSSNNFDFLNSKFEHLVPVADSIDIGIAQLKTELEKGNSNLKITGYALASEENNSIFPNLGFARANTVKNYFVSKGIPENKIKLFGEISDDLTVKSDTISGPVYFEFLKINSNDDSTKDWNALKTKINANPLTVYFETGQTSINLSNEDRQKVADMVDYLTHVEGSSLNATGHSDNVGNRQSNIRLALKRANFVKNYLVKNGIDTAKINTKSKGPDEPIADNATEEGKAKNRRTTVTLN